MRQFHLRKSIPFLVIATTITGLAIGMVAVRNRRLARDATAGLTESQRTATAHSAPMATDHPEPPPLAEPFDVPVPLVPAESDWRIFPRSAISTATAASTSWSAAAWAGCDSTATSAHSSQPEFAPPVWFDELCPNGRIPTG